MNVVNAEFMKVISEKTVFPGKSGIWRFILSRSPVIFHAGSVTECRKIGQYCLCTPGSSPALEPLDGYAMADFLEFTLSETETQKIRSLPISFDCVVSPPNWPDLSSLVQSVSVTFDSSDTYRQEKMGGFLTVLLYGIASGEEPETHASSAELPDIRMLRLRRKLSDDLSARPTVEDAAASAGLSVSRFEYLYKEKFGISFVNDLIRLRIRRSCVLLRTTDWTVSQISRFLGYENESNFFRQFRQLVGISPREYRKMLGKAPE